MSISLIVILGLPVLYLTGSLRKAAGAARIGGTAFVLYFVFAAVLSVMPYIALIPAVALCAQGAFFSIAPAVYLAFHKDYGFGFYLSCALTVLIAVSASFFTISYTITYLPVFIMLVVTFLAVVCHKRRAPVFLPVLMGIYSMAEAVMELLTDTARTVVLFDAVDAASFGFVICLAVSFVMARFDRGAQNLNADTV